MSEDACRLGRDQVRIVATRRKAVRAAHNDDRQRRQAAFPAPLDERCQEPAEIARRTEPELESEIGIGDAFAACGELGQELKGG